MGAAFWVILEAGAFAAVALAAASWLFAMLGVAAASWFAGLSAVLIAAGALALAWSTTPPAPDEPAVNLRCLRSRS